MIHPPPDIEASMKSQGNGSTGNGKEAVLVLSSPIRAEAANADVTLAP